jgi:hypothetical protein
MTLASWNVVFQPPYRRPVTLQFVNGAGKRFSQDNAWPSGRLLDGSVMSRARSNGFLIVLRRACAQPLRHKLQCAP